MAYDETVKKNAFRIYRMTGSVSQVSKVLGIPLDTLYRWQKEENWEEGIVKVSIAVQGLIALQEEAESSLQAKDDFKLLGLCDFLQLSAMDSLISDPACKPKSFKDCISAMEFVRDTKLRIMGKSKNKDEGERTSELSDEELKKELKEATASLSEEPVAELTNGNKEDN